MIGCLMYLMLGTRPDISFSVNYFSRFQDKNSDEVWIGLKRLLRYLKGTKSVNLVFSRNSDTLPIICYVDSDWGGDLSDRKSVTGFLIKIFGNTITWITRKQNCVALSSSEAELIALCTAVCDCLFFKRLLFDMGLLVSWFKVFEDNQGCISLIRNPENNKRIKHVDLKYNFVCDILNQKMMKLEYVSTKGQLADILTKGQCRDQFCSNKLGIGLLE